MRRIELMERYIANPNEVEYLNDLGINTNKLIQYRYRRINPRIDEIDRIIEIPGNNQECQVKFYHGEIITVKACFDDLCILFNDLENSLFEDGEENFN